MVYGERRAKFAGLAATRNLVDCDAPGRARRRANSPVTGTASRADCGSTECAGANPAVRRRVVELPGRITRRKSLLQADSLVTLSRKFASLFHCARRASRAYRSHLRQLSPDLAAARRVGGPAWQVPQVPGCHRGAAREPTGLGAAARGKFCREAHEVVGQVRLACGQHETALREHCRAAPCFQAGAECGTSLCRAE